MLISFGRAVLAPLDAEVNGRGLFQILSPLAVQIGAANIVIPAGFVSDGASIPWWARAWFGSWGRCGLPAILHDYLLTLTDWQKWQCDWALFGALKTQGVSDLHAAIIYLAVRTKTGADSRAKQLAMETAMDFQHEGMTNLAGFAGADDANPPAMDTAPPAAVVAAATALQAEIKDKPVLRRFVAFVDYILADWVRFMGVTCVAAAAYTFLVSPVTGLKRIDHEEQDRLVMLAIAFAGAGVAKRWAPQQAVS